MKADEQFRAVLAEVHAVRRVSRRAVRLRRQADASVVLLLARHLGPDGARGVSREVVRAYRAAAQAAYEDGRRDAKREARAELRAVLQDLAPMGKSTRFLTERWQSEIVRVLVRRFGDRAPVVSAAEDVIALMETAIGLATVAGRREGMVLGRRATDRRRKFVTDHQGD